VERGRLTSAFKQDYVELGANVFVQCGGALLLALPLLVGATRTDAATVGVFSVIIRLVGISSTFSLILNAYASRTVARVATSDPAALPRLYLLACAGNLALGGSYLAVLATFPHLALGFFGHDFATPESVAVLRTIALWMLVKQLAGFPDLFLAMRGKSHFDAWCLFFGLAVLGGAIVITGAHSLRALALAYTAGQIARLWAGAAVFAATSLTERQRQRRSALA
jgi:hypothetical protein